MTQRKSNPTIKTVALEAGVSPSTVSRVLNDNDRVDPQLREKVQNAIKKTRYTPNLAARSMKGQKSKIIGCVVPDLAMSYFKEFLASTVEEARKHDYNILAASSASSLMEEQRILQSFANSMIDGVIFFPISHSSMTEDLSMFAQTPVLIGYRTNPYSNYPHITYDNKHGGYIATKYLLSLNRRRIAFVAGLFEEIIDKDEFLFQAKNGPFGRYASIDRLNGYIKAHKEFNLEIDPDLLYFSKNSDKDGAMVANKIVSENLDVDGLVSFSDTIAIGAMNFFKNQNIRVPEDISIVGYDDSPICSQVQPTLTSVNQDALKLGVECVSSMLKMIDHEEVSSKSLDVFLNIKDSTCKKQIDDNES